MRDNTRKLRGLIERRETLLRQAKALEPSIAAETRKLADTMGFLALPRPEQVRRLVGL